MCVLNSNNRHLSWVIIFSSFMGDFTKAVSEEPAQGQSKLEVISMFSFYIWVPPETVLNPVLRRISQMVKPFILTKPIP